MTTALSPVPDRPRTAWPADELLATEFPSPVWAVPGILAEGVTVLAGKPKGGKSWLTLGLSLAVASGSDALGSIPVQPGPVLYLGLEDGPRRLRDRLAVLLHGREAPSALTVDTFCPALDSGGERYIADWLEANEGARMVVIDVLGKVCANGASSYQASYAAMGAAKRLAETYHVAIVMVHHTRKTKATDPLEMVSGSIGITGAADSIVVLDRKRGEDEGNLLVTGRDVDEAEYSVTLNPSAGGWLLTSGMVEMPTTRERIAEWVRDHPGSTPALIADGLTLDPAAVRQSCRRMVQAGALRTEPGNTYYAKPVTVSRRASDQGKQV